MENPISEVLTSNELGRHDISENDYWVMCEEARGQFNCLSGRLYGLVDALGMDEKQAKALKRLMKREVWERFGDFTACMKMFSNVPYATADSTMIGMPLDETEA